MQLKNNIQIRIIGLSKRSFTPEEENFIIQHISDKMENKDIANCLICRTTNEVKKRSKIGCYKNDTYLNNVFKFNRFQKVDQNDESL